MMNFSHLPLLMSVLYIGLFMHWTCIFIKFSAHSLSIIANCRQMRTLLLIMNFMDIWVVVLRPVLPIVWNIFSLSVTYWHACYADGCRQYATLSNRSWVSLHYCKYGTWVYNGSYFLYANIAHYYHLTQWSWIQVGLHVLHDFCQSCWYKLFNYYSPSSTMITRCLCSTDA